MFEKVKPTPTPKGGRHSKTNIQNFKHEQGVVIKKNVSFVTSLVSILNFIEGIAENWID